MYTTPDGTPVGVDDPYEHADTCDHLTDDGRCRLALSQNIDNPEFIAERRDDDYACLAHSYDGGNRTTPAESDSVSSIPVSAFRECTQYQSTTDNRACVRCGLENVRIAHDTDTQSLLEEHHLSYGSDTADNSVISDIDETSNESIEKSAQNDTEAKIVCNHEITVAVCRWCHSKIHQSFARLDDDASPDPEAFAAREQRRAREKQELGFSPANEIDDY